MKYLLLLLALAAPGLALAQETAAAPRPFKAQVATIHSALPADLRGKTFRFQHQPKKEFPGSDVFMAEVGAELNARGLIAPNYGKSLPDYYVLVDMTTRSLNPANTVYQKKLLVFFVDRTASKPGHPSMAYEGGVISEGPSAELRTVMPAMIKLLFQHFPGKDGDLKELPALPE